jgi:hypothetical protein
MRALIEYREFHAVRLQPLWRIGLSTGLTREDVLNIMGEERARYHLCDLSGIPPHSYSFPGNPPQVPIAANKLGADCNYAWRVVKL